MLLSRKKRPWTAILIVLAVAAFGAWSWREHAAQQAAEERAAPAPASGARALAAGGRAQRERAPLDGGAGEPLPSIERLPVRLSVPSVRRDARAGAGVLAGRVLSFGSQRPVAGAELSFAHEGATRAVRTDARGEFVLAADEEGTYVLALASADGFLPFAPEWGHSPVRFEARRGVRLEGVVIYLVEAIETVVTVIDDREQPVSGASVRVFGLARGERALAPLVDRFVSDEAGQARVVAPEGAVLEASHPERGRGRARLDAAASASQRLTIRLAREGTPRGDRRIAGRVVDALGEPVEGALIAAHHTALAAAGELHPPLEATSDHAGRFALEEADEGSYRLVASARGHGAVARVVESGVEDAVLTLEREGRLTVRVRDANGRPPSALTVAVTRPVGPIAEETLALESTYDAEGELVVSGLPVGRCRVVAVAPGHAPSAPVEVSLGSSAMTFVDIALGEGGSIRGRVISSGTGQPLEGARATVEGTLSAGSSPVPLESSALTDGEGRFTIRGVVPGIRSVAIWAADHHGRLRSGLIVEDGRELELGAIDLAPVGEGERPRLEMAGIGAVLSAEGDALVIGQAVEGGGAAEVGLGPGDAIVTVEGASVVELGFAGTIERIRGPEGTWVRLGVRRAGAEAVEVVAVPRRRIRA